MSNSSSPTPRALDAAFVLVVFATVGMYLVDRDLGESAMGTQLILAMAVAKCLLISSVFMGLLWTSRLALAALAVSFVALGGVLLVVMT